MKKLELYKAFLNSKRPIQKSILSRIENTLRNDFIYNSNAIEGNTLTRQETEVILEYGVTVKGKPLKDHLEVKGQEYAINFLNNIIKENETLSIRLIKEFHSLVLAPVNPEIAGQFKKFKNKIVGSNFETSDPIFVKEDLEKLLENYFSSNENIIEKITRNESELEFQMAEFKELESEEILENEEYFEIADEDELMATKRKLAANERSRTGIGAVNLASIEEFEHENERYQNIAAQKKDLLESREALLGFIRRGSYNQIFGGL